MTSRIGLNELIADVPLLCRKKGVVRVPGCSPGVQRVRIGSSFERARMHINAVKRHYCNKAIRTARTLRTVLLTPVANDATS